jgi:hypothetical protein
VVVPMPVFGFLAVLASLASFFYLLLFRQFSFKIFQRHCAVLEMDTWAELVGGCGEINCSLPPKRGGEDFKNTARLSQLESRIHWEFSNAGENLFDITLMTVFLHAGLRH